jgi:hypothetical protein
VLTYGKRYIKDVERMGRAIVAVSTAGGFPLVDCVVAKYLTPAIDIS